MDRFPNYFCSCWCTLLWLLIQLNIVLETKWKKKLELNINCLNWFIEAHRVTLHKWTQNIFFTCYCYCYFFPLATILIFFLFCVFFSFTLRPTLEVWKQWHLRRCVYYFNYRDEKVHFTNLLQTRSNLYRIFNQNKLILNFTRNMQSHWRWNEWWWNEKRHTYSSHTQKSAFNRPADCITFHTNLNCCGLLLDPHIHATPSIFHHFYLHSFFRVGFFSQTDDFQSPALTISHRTNAIDFVHIYLHFLQLK